MCTNKVCLGFLSVSLVALHHLPLAVVLGITLLYVYCMESLK